MNQQKITSLRDIPEGILRHFGNVARLQRKTRSDGDNRLLLTMATILDSRGRGGAQSLVHHDYQCAHGKYHTRKIEVYDEKIDLNKFGLFDQSQLPDPLLTICTSADHPFPNSDTTKMIWKRNLGFWIAEHLVVWYGGSENSEYTSTMIRENCHDPNFQLLMNMQLFAYQAALNVPARGHWEKEWNPRGTYLKKPSRTS